MTLFYLLTLIFHFLLVAQERKVLQEPLDMRERDDEERLLLLTESEGMSQPHGIRHRRGSS